MTDSAPSGEAPGDAHHAATTEWRVAGKLGPEEPDALVICCSDGRYRRPTEHFLYKELGLGNYDILAVPGGVFILSFASVLPKQLKVGMQMVKFIVKRHATPRIVLVGHEGCGRYREGFSTWLRRRGFDLKDKQRRDLTETARTLREALGGVRVDAFTPKRTWVIP